MPDIRFTFLVCSYLPGLPIATILYWLFLGGSYGNGQNDYFVLYFLVAPLLIGLFIDGLRHAVEKTGRFEDLFWVDLPLDEIPRIIENRGRESLARYERTEEKLYFMYEHFWNMWISCLFTLAVILVYVIFYVIFIDMKIVYDPQIILFVIVILIVLACHRYLARVFKEMHEKIVSEITAPMPESRLESESEQ